MPPKRVVQEPAFPPVHDWRTTDAHERARRRARAIEEQPRVRLLEPGPTVCSVCCPRPCAPSSTKQAG